MKLLFKHWAMAGLQKSTAVIVLSAVLVGPWVTTVDAAVLEIEAKFSPDPTNPYVNKFINTTKSTGFCETLGHAFCQYQGMASFNTGITFTSSKPIEAHEANPRQGPMFSVPVEWRTLTVTKITEGGDSETAQVKVRINGVGVRYRLRYSASELVGLPDSNHELLWQGGNWGRVASPCRSPGVTGMLPKDFIVFWFAASSDVCSKVANVTIPGFEYLDFDFGYELETPEPLKMSQGTYTGSIQYDVGPGRHFDLGDVMQGTDDVITLNFTLTVQHMLKVEVPPGGNNVVLIPQGGWQAWLQQGRKPVRLFRDQTFNISASSKFKMQLQCGQPMGNTCGLKNPAGHQVPFDVLVSLPNGLGDQNGGPVIRRQLRLDGTGTEDFRPVFYVDRKPGTLYFEVSSDSVKKMLDEHPGSTYSGTATVIWDSEV